jgi:hypothetical protein
VRDKDFIDMLIHVGIAKHYNCELCSLHVLHKAKAIISKLSKFEAEKSMFSGIRDFFLIQSKKLETCTWPLLTHRG